MKKIERCSFMSEYCIISDGSCDLPKDLAAKENITVVPFYVSFDEKNYMKEGVDIGVRDFYQKMVKVYFQSHLFHLCRIIWKFLSLL